MKHKSDAKFIIPKFLIFMKNQFHKVIKTFRSDNAQELKFMELINAKGISHQFSCVERPEQNSVVERKHQHFLNIA